MSNNQLYHKLVFLSSWLQWLLTSKELNIIKCCPAIRVLCHLDLLNYSLTSYAVYAIITLNMILPAD